MLLQRKFSGASRRAPEQPRVVRESSYLWSLNFVPTVSSSGAAHRKTLPVAINPWRSAEGKAQHPPRLQRLPPSDSVSSSGAARRKSLPVATTPWRSAERKAQVSRGMEHLRLLSTRPLPNPSVNATRTGRRLGARGRPALSSPSRPKPPAAAGALPQTLGLTREAPRTNRSRAVFDRLAPIVHRRALALVGRFAE